MTGNRLARLAQYERIAIQLVPLFQKVDDPISRAASAVSLLHNKFSHFFWTGFYRLVNNRLLVGPYQGSLACMELKKDTGVCWHAVNTGRTVIVPDVGTFAGHIACDSRSKSEIVVPVRDRQGTIIGVIDVDSKETGSFTDEDGQGLEKIAGMIAGR